MLHHRRLQQLKELIQFWHDDVGDHEIDLVALEVDQGGVHVGRRDDARARRSPGLHETTGDLERIDKKPKSWLKDQLAGPSRLPAEIRKLPNSASAGVAMWD